MFVGEKEREYVGRSDQFKINKTKTITCRENGRSANITTGNFILGCKSLKGVKPCSFCYVDRFNRSKIYINENGLDILNSCDSWVNKKTWPKVPDQTHDLYYTADIGCNVDVNLYYNYYNWEGVFDWFKKHPKLFATFASKFVNKRLLEYNPESKIRCRMTLSPEPLRKKLEKGTSPIKKRIEFIPKLMDAGYDVHINLSPVVVYGGKQWRKDYIKLFEQIKELPIKYFEKLKLEVIFLTHHEGTHYRHLESEWKDAEGYLWKPEWQEPKISQYGGENLRYKLNLKAKMIAIFKQMIDEHLKLPIRYIF